MLFLANNKYIKVSSNKEYDTLVTKRMNTSNLRKIS